MRTIILIFSLLYVFNNILAQDVSTNAASQNNYTNQSAFQILPDYHLTPDWCKAGCYFRYNGIDVKAEQVLIRVFLPMGGGKMGYRTHQEFSVHDPDWSGWWNEPWAEGYFTYLVDVQYQGVWYQTGFKAERNKWFEGVSYVIQALNTVTSWNK